jgi:hypothetical protein
MGEDIFSTVINAINKNIFEKNNFAVKNENFQKIGKNSKNQKIAFIDGGQAE